jgi:hypothetical protein
MNWKENVSVPLDDLGDIFLGPDDVPPNRARKKTRQRIGRLPLLSGPHVRVPIQWICQQRRDEYLFHPECRLFLYVLYRSHWGQVGIPVTNAFRSAINVSRDGCYKIIERLERRGWIAVERCPGHALVVRLIIDGDRLGASEGVA